MKKLGKIALIGGSFNPPTNAHVDLAHAMRDTRVGATQVLLVPTVQHPFNKHHEYEKDRIKMLRLLENEFIRVSNIEFRLGLVGRTLDMVKAVREEFHEGMKFCFVIGSDLLSDFDFCWHEARELAHCVQFIVVPRFGYLSVGYQGLLRDEPHVWLDDINIPAISSSNVRDAISKGRDFCHLVPNAVAEFIKEQKLYGIES